MPIPGLNFGQGASPSSSATSGQGDIAGPNQQIRFGSITNSKTLIDTKTVLIGVAALAALWWFSKRGK